MRKFFNAWVSRNFKGLSAHTLAEFLRLEGFFAEYADNMVYVTLFNYATKNDTSDEAFNAFECVRELVEACEWLQGV